MRDGDILTPAQVLALYEDSAMYDDDMFDGGGCAVAGGGTGPLAQPRAAAPASAAALPGGARVARHPLWPVLVDLYFACRKVGEADDDGEAAAAAAAERAELDARARAAAASAPPCPPDGFEDDEELDAFLARAGEDYVAELRQLKDELESFMTTARLEKAADDICTEFERRLRDITLDADAVPPGAAACAQMDATPAAGGRAGAPGWAGGGGGLAPRATPAKGTYGRERGAPFGVAGAAVQAAAGSLLDAACAEAGVPLKDRARLAPAAAEALLRAHLKRAHGASIRSLADGSARPRKKGKLPSEASTALKKFWCKNLAWPYPGEDDKKALCTETGLSATQGAQRRGGYLRDAGWARQLTHCRHSLLPAARARAVNNWFINQRKRHWHKLFDGKQPATAKEATAGIIRKYGTLAAGLAAMEAA